MVFDGGRAQDFRFAHFDEYGPLRSLLYMFRDANRAKLRRFASIFPCHDIASIRRNHRRVFFHFSVNAGKRQQPERLKKSAPVMGADSNDYSFFCSRRKS